jgi:hypothetical protein
MTDDLRGVIDYLAHQRGVDARSVQITATGDAPLALVAIFAACLDPRITVLDADFAGRSFAASAAQRNSCNDLPLVCNILQYGDIPQWAALLADRRVTLRHLPLSNSPRRWLEDISARVGTKHDLQFVE